MSWETCSSNASQKSVDSDTTFCEEIEKGKRFLRKRNSLNTSQGNFYSQNQIQKLSLKNKTDKDTNYKKVLEDCVWKIRNHLSKIQIMPINEIEYLVNNVNNINTPNKESKAMKRKVLSQLNSLFEETSEIEQRFSSLNINNIFQNSCSESYQDITVNDTINTITSNKTNGEQLENSFSFDFTNSSEVNINQFPICSNSSAVDAIQKDLKKLEEIEIFKNQNSTRKYYDEILQKSSTVSFSFDENILSNVNFKTPSVKDSVYAQIESSDIIMDCTQFEKSNICIENGPTFQVNENNFNFFPKNMSFEDIIPSSLVDQDNTKTFQEKLINKNMPSIGTSYERISQNTIPSTFAEQLAFSQELKVDNTLTNTICDSNENSYFKTQICNSEQSFPIEMLTNNLFETPSVKLQVSNTFDERSKSFSNEDQNYSKGTKLYLPFSHQTNENLALKLRSKTEQLQCSDITSPILKKKMNYKTQKCRYTKYSRKYKSKNFKRLKPSNIQLNDIKILQQVCLVPSRIINYSHNDAKVIITPKSNDDTQTLIHNKITPNLTDNDLINENGSAANFNEFEFKINENNYGEQQDFQTLKDVIERIDKFKQEFAHWILQTAMEKFSRKNNSNNVTQNIPNEKDITDLNFQLTADEKIENYSKINEIANFYRDKLRIEGLPKFEEFSNNPFCVDFDEIDKRYQQ